MSGSDVTQLAADFIDAFNRADWPRFQAQLAPDVFVKRISHQHDPRISHHPANPIGDHASIAVPSPPPGGAGSP